MLKVVLDTNIIVSALLADTEESLPALVFDLAINQQQIQLCYSSAMLAEYERVLSRRRFGFPKDKVKKALEAIKHRGIKVEPQETVTLITRDPQDNRVLETAQAA